MSAGKSRTWLNTHLVLQSSSRCILKRFLHPSFIQLRFQANKSVRVATEWQSSLSSPQWDQMCPIMHQRTRADGDGHVPESPLVFNSIFGITAIMFPVSAGNWLSTFLIVPCHTKAAGGLERLHCVHLSLFFTTSTSLVPHVSFPTKSVGNL